VILLNNILLRDIAKYKALEKSLTIDKKQLIDEIGKSGLKGRGGANFSSESKISQVFNSTSDIKYIVCNADEGEPGNFKDKYLMENYPHLLIEGLAILSYIINPKKCYIYVREEYTNAKRILKETIANANLDYDIEVFSGAGSYLCGEESALISSLEGKRGDTKLKPPFPTEEGLFGKPTILSNVETISNIPYIISNGSEAFKENETRLVSLSGNVNKKGVYEVPLSFTIKEIINNLGETTDNIKMVQLGGPSGPLLPYNKIDVQIKDINNFGSGAIIVINNDVNLFDVLLNNIEFFNYESCGKCTPCREGLKHVLILLSKFKNKEATQKDLDKLLLLCDTIRDTSFCGLGTFSVTSVISAYEHFKEEFTIKEEL